MTSEDNKYLNKSLLDESDEKIKSTPCAISPLHIHFTAPYWRIIDGTTKYSAFPKRVKMKMQRMSKWIKDPSI